MSVQQYRYAVVLHTETKVFRRLLDAIIEYMPAPTDIPPIEGVDEDGNEVVRHSSDEEPFSALAFKIMTDPFVGKLAYFRVYSGTMNSGSYVLNATKDKKERVGRILQMHANKREELDKVYSGDIAAAIGFKFTTTGDTICDEQHPVILESMEFPEPVIELAIEPKTKAGQGKLGESLAKLAEEDPTFRAHTDQETGQTIIAGMGELHLEIIVDRLLREFKVEANVGAPQVAYKETFTKAVDVDSKYAKQSGGRGQYGHCKVKFEPMDANGEETLQIRVYCSWWSYSEGIHSGSRRRYRRSYASQVSLEDSRLLVFTLTYMTDLTMKSIPLRWHSTLQDLLHSKMLCRRQLRYFLSLS